MPVERPQTLFSVIVICIDDHERRFQHLFCGQHRLPCAPGLCAPFRELTRDIVQILEGIVHRHALRCTHGSDPVPDHLPELCLDVLADHEYHMVEPCLDRIMDGIIHNDMPPAVHRLQLFDASAKAGADSGCHNKQCRFHRGYSFLFLISLLFFRHVPKKGYKNKGLPRTFCCIPGRTLCAYILSYHAPCTRTRSITGPEVRTDRYTTPFFTRTGTS